MLTIYPPLKKEYIFASLALSPMIKNFSIGFHIDRWDHSLDIMDVCYKQDGVDDFNDPVRPDITHLELRG
jgi:hypothetical protein